MSCELDDSQYSDCLQFASPSNHPNTPTRIQFQDAMTACSDAFLISPLPVLRHFTTGSAPPDNSPQHIPRAESFYRSISFPSTPLRPRGVFPPSLCFQQPYCLDSAPYTGSWLEQQLSSSPSPLSKVPPVSGCGLSPPTHKPEGTPFDHHFNLTQPWSSSGPDISPIARRTSDGNATYSPCEAGNFCHRFSGGACLTSPWLPMEKPSFYSDPQTFSPDRTSTPVMHSSGLAWSPVSSLSALTSLSSSERPSNDNIPDGRSCASPMCSPISGWNPTTDRYSKDHHELSSASRGSHCTTPHLRSRKRQLPENHDEELLSGRTKRACTVGRNAGSLTSQILETHSATPSQRCLPPEVSCHPGFSLFYRRYPISSFLQLDGEE